MWRLKVTESDAADRRQRDLFNAKIVTRCQKVEQNFWKEREKRKGVVCATKSRGVSNLARRRDFASEARANG